MIGLAQRSRWHPIANVEELQLRHVYQAQLLGRPFAVWRADDGHINVWEDRCLHRGTKLSIGTNDGQELKCQYHGWRYANRTSNCTYIPAHPADAPARTICNNVYKGVERYGLLWSAEEPQGEVPTVEALEGREVFSLRPIPVNAPPDLVLDTLRNYHFQPNDKIGEEGAETDVKTLDEFTVQAESRQGNAKTVAVLFIQPADSGRTVIRGVLDAVPAKADRIAVLRHHNDLLSKVRNVAEAEAATRPPPEPIVAEVHRVDPELAAMPELKAGKGRVPQLRVRVAKKWKAAEGITGFRLEGVGDELPTGQPGAHIDVHMPNGIIRQYSLINEPGETPDYIIGVKREPESTGGSKCMCDTIREGDVLATSEPRNNFPLRRDAVKTLLVAGGIGVTPLLCMAKTLRRTNLGYELHYFARSQAHLAFPEILEDLGDAVHPHLGLDPEATGQRLKELLAHWEQFHHLYVCGPGPMLDATRRIAEEQGWPEESIHYEYFSNTKEIDQSSTFEVALARSCVTLTVPAGKTIVEVVREHGVDIPTSCEQGACGTCLTAVIEGEPDHQDVYLSESEKKSGKWIMSCISRAKSDRLILDL